jgi:hypothetical protein
LFLNNGFYSVHKLALSFPEIPPLANNNLLVNGIYTVPIFSASQITDHTCINTIYGESFFCLVRLSGVSANLLTLSFEITNTEILG